MIPLKEICKRLFYIRIWPKRKGILFLLELLRLTFIVILIPPLIAVCSKGIEYVAADFRIARQGSASDITFEIKNTSVVANTHFRYNTSDSIYGTPSGSSSINNSNLKSIGYYPSTYTQNPNVSNEYFIEFLFSFTKQKTPIKIQINNNSYDMFYRSIQSSPQKILYDTSKILVSNDRISSGDLTKSIDFELVDNEQATFRTSPNGYLFWTDPTSTNNITFNYFNKGRPFGNTLYLNKWFINFPNNFLGTNIPTHILINGREYALRQRPGNPSQYYTYITVTDSGFIPTTTNLSFGINVKYSNGTYWKNTRSKLFGGVQLKPNPVHFFKGNKPAQAMYIYRDGRLVKVWQNTNPPSITAFSVTPTTVDLDSPPANLVFTLNITGTTGQETNAKILLEPQGTQVGTSFAAPAGQNLAQSNITGIPIPDSTQTYRAIATNDGGASHKDLSITVTKNPVISNCRRTGFTDATTRYRFGFTVTGLPRPTVSYSFSNSLQTGNVPFEHYTQGANRNTWNIDNWFVVFATPQTRSLTLTATNSQGTSTCTINNIND